MLRTTVIPVDPVSAVLVTTLVVGGYIIQNWFKLPFISIIPEERTRLRKMLHTGFNKLTWKESCNLSVASACKPQG